MKNLDIKVQEKSTGVFYIKLIGPLDTYTHELFDYRMEPILIPMTRTIVLDMEAVDYISSMGIGSLFKLRKFAKENNSNLAIVNLQPQVEKVIETLQAVPQESIFKSIKEIDEYLDHIQKNAQKDK